MSVCDNCANRTVHRLCEACSDEDVEAIRATERVLVIQQAVHIALTMCRCAEFWKPYGRIDPSCAAHDIADSILELLEKDRVDG